MCCGTEKIEIPSWVPVSGLQICPARVQFGGVGWLRRYGVGRNAECAKASVGFEIVIVWKRVRSRVPLHK